MSLLLFRPLAGTGVEPLTVPLAHVRIAWRPEQFDRCTNPGFETDTTDWSVSAGLNGAGTSITRITSDFYSGVASGQLVTAASIWSGGHYSFGTMPFRTECIYTARFRLKRVSGGRRALLRFGDDTESEYVHAFVQDLSDTWEEYTLRWQPPYGPMTDVQLAIATGDDRALTVNIDDVRVYLDAFSQVERGDFETDAEGWETGAGNIAAAATSGALVTGDSFAGNASYEVVTTATSGSGVDYPIAGTFVSGRTYRLRVGIRTISGVAQARLRLGSVGTALDRGSASHAITTSWTSYTVDWTPTDDRSDACVAISNATAAVATFRIDEVEVYEKVDEVSIDSLSYSRGAAFDGGGGRPGTTDLSILDPSGTYSPRNPASTLYGSVAPGKRILARATYSGRLYGASYGVVRDLTPDPDFKKVAVHCEDGLFELGVWSILRRFDSRLSYADARGAALDNPEGNSADKNLTAVFGDAPVLMERQRDIGTAALESSTFFDGTDGTMGLLAYLDDLNEATGTVHWCEPSPHAMVGWRYTTLDRATLTGTRDVTDIDEDFQRLSDVTVRDEAMVTRQRVSFQGYDIYPPPDATLSGEEQGAGTILQAYDPTIVDHELDLPYLTYTREEYGNTEEPKTEAVYAMRRVKVKVKGWEKGDKGPKRKRRWKRRKVGDRFIDAFVPLAFAADSTTVHAFDFDLPVEDMDVGVSGLTTASQFFTIEPARVAMTTYGAGAANTMTSLQVIGKPFLPRDEGEAEVTSAWPVYEGSPISSPYVPGPAAAEGLAKYITSLA